MGGRCGSLWRLARHFNSVRFHRLPLEAIPFRKVHRRSRTFLVAGASLAGPGEQNSSETRGYTVEADMRQAVLRVPEILQKLESHYGKQEPVWPTDPYLFLVWWYCGYPASDAACARGWESLNRNVGVEPSQLLAASAAKLATALKPGGMVPELRAMRLLELAARVHDEFAGDVRAALLGPMAKARRLLKTFRNIADPGADRILLFGGFAPIAAVPSNCPHVLVRIRRGWESENYGANYREAQQAIEAETPATLDARTRAYLLLKRHGQELCKSKNPRCNQCPVSTACAFLARNKRGRDPA
jgi:endonuclease-3